MRPTGSLRMGYCIEDGCPETVALATIKPAAHRLQRAWTDEEKQQPLPAVLHKNELKLLVEELLPKIASV